jgi:hypothetical protein
MSLPDFELRSVFPEEDGIYCSCPLATSEATVDLHCIVCFKLFLELLIKNYTNYIHVTGSLVT